LNQLCSVSMLMQPSPKHSAYLEFGAQRRRSAVGSVADLHGTRAAGSLRLDSSSHDNARFPVGRSGSLGPGRKTCGAPAKWHAMPMTETRLEVDALGAV